MIVDTKLTLGLDELSEAEWRKVMLKLTFTTPNGEVVTGWQHDMGSDTVTLFRGAWNVLPDHVVYHDHRTCPPGPRFKLGVTLDSSSDEKTFTGQEEAVQTMLDNEQGIVVRPPGTGKTTIALAAFARAGTPALVIVHTKDLLEQWIEACARVVPDAKVGVIQGQRFLVGDITIGMAQSLTKYAHKKSLWARFGMVIVDEAHHAAAVTWSVLLRQMPARYRLGLTASPVRADGMDKVLHFHLGPVISREKFASRVPVKVVVVPTEYRAPSSRWHRVVATITRDEKRNALIARLADQEVKAGNSVLVLSQSIDHLALIDELMTTNRRFLLAASGPLKSNAAKRKEVLRDFRSGKLRCLLATQLADEGVDIPRLNRVILAFPGTAEAKIIQRIGRATREHREKTETIIYDIVDHRSKMLKRQADERRMIYRQLGLKIEGERNLTDGIEAAYRRLLHHLQPRRG